MPNHIQNRLQIIATPKKVKEVLNFISAIGKDGEELQIDFNKIVPMPEGMSVEAHSAIIDWAQIVTCQVNYGPLFQAAPDVNKIMNKQDYGYLSDRLHASTCMEMVCGKRKSVKDFTGEEFEMFIQCVRNIRNHGFATWYEWSIKNWGTKWNAYSQNDRRNSGDTIYFQTAWSAPLGLIQTLSKKFYDCEMIISYADEDSGSNTGIISFKNGEPVNVSQPKSQSIESYDIYFELHPNTKENYKLVGDTYEYIEQD